MSQMPLYIFWVGTAIAACLSGCSMDSGTLYAPMFSEEGFGGIKVGMHSNEVVKSIGVPLRVDHQLASERWSYFLSGKSGVHTNAGPFVKSGDFSIPSVVVSFDRSGTVVDQLGVRSD